MKLAISGPSAGTGRLPGAEEQDLEGNLLVEQGVFLPEGRGRWQIGRLCLTADRLRFMQPRGTLFDIPLGWIRGVELETRSFVVVHKPSMAVTFQDPRRRDTGKVWFLTPMIGQWLTRLAPAADGEQHALAARSGAAQRQPSPAMPTPDDAPPRLHIADVERLACRLEPADQEILWHLWFNRHATIRELAALIGAPTHMDVLTRIRTRINLAAEQALGRPLLRFEAARIDPQSGRTIAYSWWLAGRVTAMEARPEPNFDLFDEPDGITVVVELAGVAEEAIRVSVDRRKVAVWVEDITLRHYTELELPAPVNCATLVTHFVNGVLSINLKKEEGSVA